jgi:hypothetical protein
MFPRQTSILGDNFLVLVLQQHFAYCYTFFILEGYSGKKDNLASMISGFIAILFCI